jgi:hypothetical protein
LWQIRTQIANIYANGHCGEEGGNGNGNGEKEKGKFIKPCPSEDCRGFLSTQWKCGLCQVHVCSKCHVAKKDDEDHVCHPDDVATAEFLMKDTKSCPKCATAIHKIEGCDQMWCTQCQTAFSWRTNEVIHGIIHNPHYFQWLRQQNRQGAERNPLDTLCGRELDHRIVAALSTELIQLHLGFDQYRKFQMIFENILYLKAETVHRFRVMDVMNHRQMRIQYLNQEMSEKEFKRQIFIRYRHNEINREMRYSLLLFRDVATEIVHNLYEQLRNHPEKVEEHLQTFETELQTIQTMVLTDLETTCKLFQITVRSFDVFANNQTWMNKLFPIGGN